MKNGPRLFHRFAAQALACSSLAVAMLVSESSTRAESAPFDYPGAVTHARVTAMSDGSLAHRQIFATTDDPAAILSFYDALMAASGWKPYTNPADFGSGCPSCPSPAPCPNRKERQIQREYKRQDAFFSVVLRPEETGSLGVWRLRMNAPAPLPLPEMEPYVPLYPHGATTRLTRAIEGPAFMMVYEFQCSDNPGLFFSYLDNALPRGSWQANPHLAWAGALTRLRTVALYQKNNRQLAVIATGERDGLWQYTIIFKEAAHEST